MAAKATRRLAALAVSTLAALPLAFVGAPAPAFASATCDVVAAPSGSDSSPGTEAQPLRSAVALVSALGSGQTGCFRSGTYAWSGDLSLDTPATTITPFPGEHATLKGRVRIEASAGGAVIEGLTLDGSNSSDGLSPLVYASNAVLRDNEITNNNTSICVTLDGYPGAAVPSGVVIEGNRIHNCGKLPADNFDHGIYVGEANGTIIRNNLIYDNANRGIQLYSQAHNTLVTGNVIDGNGQGVAFGGEQTDPSSGNIVEHNVISNSTIRDNVEASWGGNPGTGNLVRENCVGGGNYDSGDGGILSGPKLGFAATDNTIAKPAFANSAGDDFTIVAGSACDGILGHSGPVATSGSGPHRLTLKASKNRVEVGTRLAFKGKAKGAETVGLMVKRRNGTWKTVRNATVGDDGRFRAKVAAAGHGHAIFKAAAAGWRDSKRVRVRIAGTSSS